MTNFEMYHTLVKTEEIIFEQMHKLASYSEEWEELDSARRVIASLQEKFR